MSDVGGLGRIPSGIERVNRSHASRDEPRRPQKDKKKKDSESETRSETSPDTSLQPEAESKENETGTVIDILDDRVVVAESDASKEDSDDHDPEERGRHLDTRA